MKTLKKLFPISFREPTTNNLVVTIIIYVVVSFVVGLVFGLLSKIPLIGWVFSLVSSIIGLYCFIGIVIVVLFFLKIIK